MDQGQRTSIKIEIHTKTQDLLRQQLITLFKQQNHSALKTHMTIFIVCTIIMNTLILLIHKNRTVKQWYWKKLIPWQDKLWLDPWRITWPYFPRPWQNISISKNELRYHDNSSQWYRTHHWRPGGFSPIIQLTPKWTQGGNTSSNNHHRYHRTTVWRIKLSFVHLHQTICLYHTCPMQFTNSQWQQNPWKRFWPCHHKNPQNNHYYTTLYIVLYAA